MEPATGLRRGGRLGGASCPTSCPVRCCQCDAAVPVRRAVAPCPKSSSLSVVLLFAVEWAYDVLQLPRRVSQCLSILPRYIYTAAVADAPTSSEGCGSRRPATSRSFNACRVVAAAATSASNSRTCSVNARTSRATCVLIFSLSVRVDIADAAVETHTRNVNAACAMQAWRTDESTPYTQAPSQLQHSTHSWYQSASTTQGTRSASPLLQEAPPPQHSSRR